MKVAIIYIQVFIRAFSAAVKVFNRACCLSDGGTHAVHHDHAGLPLGVWNLQSGNCLPHPRTVLDDHERHLLLPLLADLRGTVSR